tara:strand:- start:609 stop:1415 length:807 start_codon:yes stop_codon:yes gene_type:complete
MDEVKKFCVMGLPVSHSLSPQIHKEFAKQQGINIQYKMIEPDTEEHFETHAQSFFSKKGYGANVTIPFKEKAYNFADSCDISAQECGCANTLVLRDNDIKAFNTDGAGFINDFKNKNISLAGKHILILGAGGSAKSIINSLSKHSMGQLSILTRTIKKADDLIEKFNESMNISHYKDNSLFDIVVNTTPISLTKNDISFPTNIFKPSSISYDLFYSKAKTNFQDWSMLNGAEKTYDGLGMLIEQAALSYDIWNNFKPETKSISKLLGF